MKRVAVDSSMIASVGYDPKTQTLEAEFTSGGVYEYYDVPQEVYDDIFTADSVGVYFKESIIDDYEYRKIKYRR